jgi:uncharacterized protein
MQKIFSIIAIVSIILSNLFLYLIWDYYLNLGVYLALLIIFLGLFSALAYYLISRHDNFLTRIIYLLATLWWGIILNSLLLFLFFYFLDIILKQLNLFIDPIILASFYFSLQIPLLLLEFLSVYLLRTRRITVAIENLPKYWENKRILHISDVHLGPIWRLKFLKRLLQKITDLKTEAIFITGDLFDGLETDFSYLDDSLNKISAPSGIYYSLGNHDEDLGSDKVRELLKDSNIKILENNLIEIKGLQVIGLMCGFSRKVDVRASILKQMGYSFEKPSILLYHEPLDINEAKMAGINLQLSGHTHGGQMFPLNLVIKILYKGYNFGVFKKNGLTLSVTSGVGTWGPPLRLGSRSEIVEITLKNLEK